MSVDPTTEAAIFKALEEPAYKWRTVGGVAKSAGTTPEQVIEVLSAHRDRIVKSTIPDPTGHDLYTTREHFRDQTPALKRFIGALRNRID